MYGDEVVALFARVKRAFDPLGIFNPGVILPCPDGATADTSAIGRLKVGARAAALPDDIAVGLRRIEQRGIAPDHAALAQAADPFETGGGRNAALRRQRLVRDAAIALQHAQQFSVGLVHRCSCFRLFPAPTRHPSEGWGLPVAEAVRAPGRPRPSPG